MKLTVGLELEWADVDRHTPIPEHLGQWNRKDYSIVNSDGHANCPTGETWRWGGEINTQPSYTTDQQALIVRELGDLLHPVINYKCNLHVHVGVLGLKDDLSKLKQVAQYLRDAEQFVYTVVEPIQKPTALKYLVREQLLGAQRYYRRRLISHHYSLPLLRWQELMKTETPDEFLNAHAPPRWGGGRSWHIAPRPGMNMRSLWKHGTIEYRHFPGTINSIEAESCAKWCLRVTEAALNGGPSPKDIWLSRGWSIPKFLPYVHNLHQGFLATRWKK